MADRFTIEPFEASVLPARTRFPFRYGIAAMTEVPHVFLRTRVTAGAASSAGLASDGLPPKWFTKDPATTFDEDLPEMLRVLRHAAAAAADVGREPHTFFEWWRQVNAAQTAWAAAHGVAPLLAGLGVSLVERAVLDGLCRAWRVPLHRLLRSGRLDLRLEALDRGPAEDLRAFLPAVPLPECHVRHTVGLGDPLLPAEIPAGERVHDGLPQDLQSSIQEYGLCYFKIKLTGVEEADLTRLGRLSRILGAETHGRYAVTLDGNENFPDFDVFRAFWTRAAASAELRELWQRILVVEQPVHRSAALDAAAGRALGDWQNRPPVIIDESDGALDDLPRALALGYDGTSHKNCKGIVKGLSNAALLAARRRLGRPGVLTGEDLCNLGPVALLQDLAMTALLGIGHVERNGHHYYRGLHMLPADWQAAATDGHRDLYRRHPGGFAALRITKGRLALGSANAAPFGVGFLADTSPFAPLDLRAAGGT